MSNRALLAVARVMRLVVVLALLALVLALTGCNSRPTYLFMPPIPCEARSALWCARCWQEDVTLHIEAHTGATVVWPVEDSTGC